MAEDHLRKIEHGEVVFPRPDTVNRIAKALGVRIEITLVAEEQI
jgi:hypothetical protein